jgi:small subunit ribosomal protein S2
MPGKNKEEKEEITKELVDASEEIEKKECLIEGIDENVKEGLEAIEELAEEGGETLEEKQLEKAAEAESTDTKTLKELEKKRRAVLERAKKLKEKISIETPTTEELKEKVKGKKKTEMLIPLEDYVKSGIYLGTRVVTPSMKKYVYRRRADGLAIFNTDLIDEKLKEGIGYLSKFPSEEVIVVCKRAAGWQAVELFSKITGIRAFTKEYPAGILTNTNLDNFFENELTIISDSWVDRNALRDTLNVRKKVLMICDTNNFAKGADQIIIGNNKSAKSVGLIFYLLAKGYCKARGIKTEIPDLEFWTGDVEEKVHEKTAFKIKADAGAQFGV